MAFRSLYRRPRALLLSAQAALFAASLALPKALAEAEEAPSSGALPSGGPGAIRVPAEPPPEEEAPVQVIPPRLVHFESAPYPDEALAEGLEASVVLQLDIDREGKVTNVVVVEPVGHGFDEAASEAARQFEFAPAMRGEAPIPARILYRYDFTLSPPDAEEEEAPEPISALRGVVKAMGEVPLPGATVTAIGELGEFIATTNEEGLFAFEDLPPGSYRLKIEAPGFEILELEEELLDGTELDAIYRISPPTEGAFEVTIVGERPPREVTRRTIERREMERIPGTGGDALRSLQSLPGVARPPGLAGMLIVRGSSPQDTRTFIDGTEVPLVYHFGGLSSVVPTEMLEKIDFYPGNFSSQYGRLMGGIVEVGIRSPKDDGRYHGMAQLDLIDMRGMLEGPVPFAKGWNFIVGARRSWVDTWLKPVLVEAGAGVTSAPVYYDYQAFIETKPTSRSLFRVGVLGSDDRFEMLMKDVSEEEPLIGGNLGLYMGFWRVQALYRNDISDTLRYQGMIAYGGDNVQFGAGSLYLKINNQALTHRSELTARLSPGVSLHGGLDLAYMPYDAAIRAPQPPRPGEPNPGPFGAKPPSEVKESGAMWRPAAYIEAELSPSRRAKIIPGIRADYAKDTERWDASPRINGRYDLAYGFPRTTAKAGMGLYHQPPQPQETNPIFGTPGLYSQRSTHYSLGVEQDVTRNIEASVEGFYKDLDRLVSRAPTEGGAFDYANFGAGYVVGAEMMLKYKPDDRFFGWLAYTLSRSIRKDGAGQPERFFEWDQTHILTALGSYKLGRGWEFGARFRLVSGRLYTPILGGLFDANAGSYAAVSGEPYSRRLPMFHQLDLRVDKEWAFEAWRLRLYLDVQNAYNHQYVEGISYNYNYSQSSEFTGLPIIPSLGLRGDF